MILFGVQKFYQFIELIIAQIKEVVEHPNAERLYEK